MLPATLFNVILEHCTTISLTHIRWSNMPITERVFETLLRSRTRILENEEILDTSILIESAAYISLLDGNAMVSLPLHFSAALH